MSLLPSIYSASLTHAAFSLHRATPSSCHWWPALSRRGDELVREGAVGSIRNFCLLIRKFNDFKSLMGSAKKSSSVVFPKRDINTSSIQAAELLRGSALYIGPMKSSSPKIQYAAKNKSSILVKWHIRLQRGNCTFRGLYNPQVNLLCSIFWLQKSIDRKCINFRTNNLKK